MKREKRFFLINSWREYIMLLPMMCYTFDREWYRVYVGWLFWGFWFGVKKEKNEL